MGYRIALGRGDIHVPPLWGKIPYDKVFSILKDYDKIVLCEFYTELFSPFYKEIKEDVQALIIKSRSIK
jgi:sugar phosphate isomerase/epimerase